MIDNNVIDRIISEAISEVNKQLPKRDKISDYKTSEYFGDNGKLDSLGLINFIVILEEEINKNLNIQTTLAKEELINTENSPFKNYKNLSEYINSIL